MNTAAARIDPAVMRALADHYASLPGLVEPTTIGTEAATIAADANDASAARIVASGLRAINLPACSKCHAAGKRPDYPRLSGQKPEYLAARLRRWRGDPGVVDARKDPDTMPMIARRIPEAMIEPLARLLARR